VPSGQCTHEFLLTPSSGFPGGNLELGQVLGEPASWSFPEHIGSTVYGSPDGTEHSLCLDLLTGAQLLLECYSGGDHSLMSLRLHSESFLDVWAHEERSGLLSGFAQTLGAQGDQG
jgi:hypothetical protein